MIQINAFQASLNHSRQHCETSRNASSIADMRVVIIQLDYWTYFEAAEFIQDLLFESDVTVPWEVVWPVVHSCRASNCLIKPGQF